MSIIIKNIYIHLIWLFCFMLFYTNIFCQSKKTDSLFSLINKKLDDIDIKLSHQGSTIKESKKDSDLKDKNKELKEQNEDLNSQIKVLNLQISKEKKRADDLETANSKSEDGFKKQKELLLAKERENQSLNNREKAALEKEIAAILNQGHTLPQNLIFSFQERSLESKVKPSNQNYLTEYTNAHKKINDTYLLLNSAYDGNKVKEANILIEKINLDAITFSGLMANKKELISLLGKYCEKTNELSKIIEDAKVKSDENKRKDWLEGFTFKTKGIPYLSIQLEKAIKDRNYKLEKVNCQ